MDNRITKTRLGDFLSYEWIIMILITVLAIVGFEFLYIVSGVRLTTGQTFCYYYDENVSGVNDISFLNTITTTNTFSYDILNIKNEKISSEYNVLNVRAQTQELDAIFTDTYSSNGEGEYKFNKAKKLIDEYDVFSVEDTEGGIINGAKKYLSQFLSNPDGDPLDFNGLDKAKIQSHFKERTKNHRVYRNSINAGEISVENEYQRIQKLCEDTSFLIKALQYDDTLPEESKIFYSYKRYEQANASGEKSRPVEETAKRFGLNVSRLGDEARKFFTMTETEKQADIILVLFDYTGYQPDLQYESISFMCSVIKNYSTLANGINGI